MSHRPDVKINQLVLANIQKGNWANLLRWVNTFGLVIAEHSLNSHQCIWSYSQDMFLLLRKAHSYFYLNHYTYQVLPAFLTQWMQ